MSADDFCDCVKIMPAAISAVLGVIIFVPIVHFYDRYGFRHQQRRRRAILYRRITIGVAPTEVNSSHEPPRTGLGQSVISLLPKFVYKASHRLGHGDTKDCSICLSNMEEATVRLLPNCMHLFHVDCIDRWLSSKTTCPYCRTDPRPQQWMVSWVWWWRSLQLRHWRLDLR